MSIKGKNKFQKKFIFLKKGVDKCVFVLYNNEADSMRQQKINNFEV